MKRERERETDRGSEGQRNGERKTYKIKISSMIIKCFDFRIHFFFVSSRSFESINNSSNDNNSNNNIMISIIITVIIIKLSSIITTDLNYEN